MKITRHNYEEFFILYLDKELGSEDRRGVELFVKENPDLQAELDILLQSQLSADTEVVFAGKETLLKTAGSSISENNYEEWLLSYIDNELPAAEKSSLEQFVADRPAIKAELEVLQKTKLQPENIAYGDKSSLYRREEKVRIIALNWRRIAIAASLILAVSTTSVVLYNSKDDKPGDIVSNESKKTIPAEQSKNPVIKEVTKEAELTDQQLAVTSVEPANEEKDKEVAPRNENRIKRSTPVVEKVIPAVIKKEELATVVEKKGSNELPEPIYNPNVNKASPQDNPIAMNEPAVQKPLTNSKETSPVTTVTPATTGALYTSNTSPGSFDPVDENQPGKKNKLRGFFRKVTRTFEKNTNIKATDDEDRLLLGGLAIKL